MSETVLAMSQAYALVTSKLEAYDDIFFIPGQGLNLYLQRNFLTPIECAYLIDLIDQDSAPSTVLGHTPDPEYRTSYSSPLGHKCDPKVKAIDDRINQFLGISTEFGEPLGGHRYHVGQQFKPHYDWFRTSEPYWPDQDQAGGQRTWSAIACLNTPTDGGGTMFPEAGVRVKPRAGNLLIWSNIAPDGHPSLTSLHCGEPVKSGTKYILAKWYRVRPFRANI